ncbi:nucleotidyltransferase domain-containing protein [Micromonospora sp. NPDC004551]|uniref:nucleotidyltransferase domain-containing protein n=1 Tax=Micromonospora sp. NPDC004551 TaxID=3154284 RepID=UPI0033A8489C
MSGLRPVPDAVFSDRQCAAARAVVEDLGGPEQVHLAFLGGSLAVGLGHATSDVDLYVVADRPPGSSAVLTRDGVEVHVLTLDAAMVTRLIDVGSAYAVTGADRGQLNLDPRTRHGLVRVLTGWRLRCTDGWERELGRLRRDVVRQIFMAHHAAQFAGYAEDVLGALDARDPYTALASSSLALTAAAEAALAASDDIYLGDKFLFRRLTRTPVTAPWAGPLWALLHEPVAAGDPLPRLRGLTDRRLRAGNLLLAWCALEGWSAPLTALPAPLTALPAPPAAAPAWRSPYATPLRFRDGLALIGPGESYRVDDAVLRRWRDARPGDAGDDLRALAALGLLGDGAPEPAPPGTTPPPGARPEPSFAWQPRTDRLPDPVPAGPKAGR